MYFSLMKYSLFSEFLHTIIVINEELFLASFLFTEFNRRIIWFTLITLVQFKYEFLISCKNIKIIENLD